MLTSVDGKCNTEEDRGDHALQIVAGGHGAKNIIGEIAHDRINDAAVIRGNIARVDGEDRHIQTDARLKDKSEDHAKESTDCAGNSKKSDCQATQLAQLGGLQTADGLHNRTHDQSNKRHLDQAHKEISKEGQIVRFFLKNQTDYKSQHRAEDDADC